MTPEQRAETMRRSSGEVAAALLTITHANLAAPIRIVNAAIERISEDPRRYGVISGGQTFEYLPFEFAPPEEGDGADGSTAFTVPNLSTDGALKLAAEFRLLTSPASVEATVIMTPDVDLPVMSFNAWEIHVTNATDEEITATLVADGLTQEPAPTGRYDRRQFPGMFR